VLDDEQAMAAAGFLGRAVKHFAGYGITVERLITDYGNPYRSTVHAIACRALGIRHIRTRPNRPQTNGKAERSSEPSSPAGPTARSTATAANATPRWPAGSTSTVRRPPHGALGHKPPIARLNELNNLLGPYI
jgi:transposase InsO family protein